MGPLLTSLLGMVSAGRLKPKSIQETFVLAASDADVLKSASRIQSVPENSLMIIEASATKSDAANNGKITLTTPDGIIPLDSQQIVANGYSASEAVLHRETSEIIELPVQQGGHVFLNYTASGTLLTAIRVTIYF